MNSKNEQTILSIIKFTPPVFIITISIITFITLYVNSKKTFEKERIEIEKNFIQKNKEKIQQEVNNIHKFTINQKKHTESYLKEEIKHKVQQAYEIAMNIYNENKHLSKQAVQKMIKDALRPIRFNKGRGYFFIYSLDYECILLPVLSKNEGKNYYNFKDGKGRYLSREIVKMVKNKKEGFINWWYINPNTNKISEKIGFNKYFEPFDWYIGTGEYVKEYEKNIKKNILSYIADLESNNNNHIFIIDKNANYLNHTIKKLIGKNALKENIIDKDTLDTMKSIIQKKQSGFITYAQNHKLMNGEKINKTTYITSIPDWNWIIGKGFYEDDVEKILSKKRNELDRKLKKTINDIALLSIILTIILLFISIYISKLLGNKFKKYKIEINNNLKEISKQHNILAHQSKMAALGEMMGNIAHQWRQPLNLISVSASSMQVKKQMNVLEDKDFDESLEYINNATQYLSQTIDDFRNFFSKDKKQIEFTLEEILKDTLNIIGAQFKNKEITINENICNSKIKGFKSEFIQVIINILNNSKDELIKLKEQERLIFIDSVKEKNIFKIIIKDNAGGLNKDTLNKAFEPYFTTKKESQGTGIGLYMSQSIIEKHMNGKIYMENIKFKHQEQTYTGAITTIELPLIK